MGKGDIVVDFFVKRLAGIREKVIDCGKDDLEIYYEVIMQGG